MTTDHEALVQRLNAKADELINNGWPEAGAAMCEAAAALRELGKENEFLMRQKDQIESERDTAYIDADAEIDQLRAERDRLIEAKVGYEAMTTLAEVAADVVQALGLMRCHGGYITNYAPPDADYVMATGPMLLTAGTNLTEPYWFKRCCEWLNEEGYLVGIGHCWPVALKYDSADNIIDMSQTLRDAADSTKWIRIMEHHPFGELPARLVSAVWRRMQGEKP